MKLEVEQNKNQGRSLKRAVSLGNDAGLMVLNIECLMGAYFKHNCKFTVEVPETLSLTDLHYVIQQAVQFADDHMYAFHAGRNYRNRKVLFGEEEDRDYDLGNLDDILLQDVYPLPKSCKLYYVFDFGDDWIFEIRKLRTISKPVQGRLYPFLVGIDGKIPEQYPSMDS